MNTIKSISKYSAVILLISLFTASFYSFTTTTSNTEAVKGCWVYKSYKDGVYTFIKSNDFKANKPGYKFLSKGKMIKRLDPNWCVRVAGPYTNLEGSFKFLDKNTLETKYQCPISDKASFNKYQILELTKKKMMYKSLPRK